MWPERLALPNAAAEFLSMRWYVIWDMEICGLLIVRRE